MPLLKSAFLVLALLMPAQSDALGADMQRGRGKLDVSRCDPASAGALAAKASDVTVKPKGHRTEKSANLKLTRAQLIEGKCVPEIEFFVAGSARLASGMTFVVGNYGSVTLHPPQGLISEDRIAVNKIAALPGYTLSTVRSLGWRPHPLGDRKIYLGLFKAKSGDVIARFDVVNDRPSETAEILIRTTSPISGLGFLGAADTTEGSIGFVQPAGPNKAWLYAYSWQHGALAPLAI